MTRYRIKELVAVMVSLAMLLVYLPSFAAPQILDEVPEVQENPGMPEESGQNVVENSIPGFTDIMEGTGTEAPTSAPEPETTPEENDTDDIEASPEPVETAPVVAEGAVEIETPEADVVQAAGLDETPDGEPTRDENGYITSTYGYSLKGDPYVNDVTINSYTGSYNSSNKVYNRYTMSDQTFFGVWDAQKEVWTTEGKFNFAKYPDLADVETAVKQGDYDAAKLALYNYYLVRERNGHRTKDTYSEKKDRITADLLTENYMYNANSGMTPLDFMTVTPEEQYVDCDVTDTVTKYLGSRSELSFLITATNKDGGTAEFYSKEADRDSMPYLNVKVNGTDMTLYPTADTYIMAGGNKSNKYGSETTLIARESGINDPKLVDSNTARIYLKFDVSKLREGDTITAASLNLKGRNSTGDGEKKTVVYYTDDSNWDESKTWSSTAASTIFSYDQLDTWSWVGPGSLNTDHGYRYPEELLRFNTWMDKLVKMYNLTGDEKYAYTTLRLIMDFINVTKSDTRHQKDLDIAVRSQVFPGYMMQLLECDSITPDIFTGFMKYMWIEGNEFLKFFTSSSNWGSSERMGHYAIALNFQEFTDASKWFADIRSKYSSVLDHIYQSDGSSYELALGYTDYTLDTVIGAQKIADAAGIEGESPFTEKTKEAIHGLARFMMFTSMPGYIDNQEGDGYSHRSGYIPKRIAYVGEWFQDQELIFGGSNNTKGKEPDFKSILYPYGKKAAMRTDWGDKANYLYASVDGGVGNHAHKDDNNIMVSAYGQYLLVDPLYGSYTTNNDVKWLKSSQAHNIVTVNPKSKPEYTEQGTGGGTKVNRWETNESYDYFEGYTPNVTDAAYTRKILFVKPGFWLVTDYLVPKNSNSNKYSQAWHFLPEANISVDEETGIVRTNLEQKPNIQVVPVETDELDSVDIKDGLYSEGQGSFLSAKYAVHEKTLKGTAVFNTVLFPEDVGESYDIVTAPITLSGVSNEEASAYELYVTNKSSGKTSRYQYYIVNDSTKKAMRSVGAHTTDASMLFVELDEYGDTKSIIAQDVTSIRNDASDKVVFQSDQTTAEVSMEWDGEYMQVRSSVITEDTLKKNNVVISNQGQKVKKVLLNTNTKSIPFNQTANFVYFGSKPDDGEGTEASPTPKPTSKPAHGPSGGGGGGGIVVPNTTPTPGVTSGPSGTPEPSSGPREMSPAMQEELSGHWAEKEISSLYQQGIISGVSEDSLGLAQQVTRAEFVTLMVRVLGLEVPEYQGGFSDVSSEDWYAGYIQAASDQGLLSGFDGKANPGAGITREEMAKILSAAAEKAGVELGTGGDLSGFSDAAEVSDWAAGDVEKVVAGGLMNGMPDSTFAPKADTKREEAFVVVYRLLEKMK